MIHKKSTGSVKQKPMLFFVLCQFCQTPFLHKPHRIHTAYHAVDSNGRCSKICLPRVNRLRQKPRQKHPVQLPGFDLDRFRLQTDVLAWLDLSAAGQPRDFLLLEHALAGYAIRLQTRHCAVSCSYFSISY